MRLIKFRAWDKSGKRMWWNVQDAYDTLRYHHSPDPDSEKTNLDKDTFFPSSFGVVLEDDNYAVMQYTGLRDKNGKEIYEGDIVKEFDGLCKGIEYITRVGWEQDSCTYSFLKPDWEKEVIGNVWENPELLK